MEVGLKNYISAKSDGEWCVYNEGVPPNSQGVVRHRNYKTATTRCSLAQLWEEAGYCSPALLMGCRGNRSRQQFANELGISLRGLESYEYAARPIPEIVRKLAELLKENEND